MNQWKRLVTAGAGATIALTLVIGPAAVAIADPGSRGSSSGQSDRRAATGARAADSTSAGPASNESAGDAAGSDQPGAAAQGRRARPSLTTADGARTVRTARTARTADEAGTGGAGLRPVAPAEPVGRALPQITTAARTPQPAAAPQPSVSPVPASADVVVSAPTAPVPQPAASPPAVRLPVVDMSVVAVLPIGPDPRPGQPMTSLFGILGLLLIPLAGAALGYRQARAARALPPAGTSGLPPA